ncbi:MAG: hypothetical protein ACLPXZ_10670 [Mycobacterium sp.]
MNSLRKTSLIACAVASVLGSGAALALDPTVVPDYTLYAGGGSAQANAFFVGACQIIGTNADVYSDLGVGNLSGSYYVMFGSTTAAFTQGSVTVPAGKNVLWMYKFSKGSYTNGVQPQQTVGATTLPFPTPASVLASPTPLPLAHNSCTSGLPTAAYTITLDAGDAPTFGLSDVEVPMFQHYNNATGNAGSPAPNTDGGPAPAVAFQDGIYDNLFGLAVTDDVYSNAAHPKKDFTRAEVEGIISGTIGDWSQLYDDNGNQMPAGAMIYLDRTEGSGTKTSGSEYFLGYPSNGAAAKLPFSATAGYSSNNPAVVAQVRQVVAESTNNTMVTDFIALNGAGIRAVGVLGLENPPGNQTTTGQYDFAAINGVHVDSATPPLDDINKGTHTSYSNVIRGDYDFFFQNSFNAMAGVIGGATVPDAFAGQMITVMKAAAFSGCNSGNPFPLAVTGTLVDADNAAAIVKGVTLATRNKNSQAPLQAKAFPALAVLPACSDPV